ncbi:hypothetical protein LWI28_002857 [Acer negundo]|uniref:Uncharacterized protein n=1 Tax=Acer negundo TaxID=4023 RepID=A0AAD5P0V0_ACENE|nr:hypothetical protein LWI28_002857 [Acer negundo]
MFGMSTSRGFQNMDSGAGLKDFQMSRFDDDSESMGTHWAQPNLHSIWNSSTQLLRSIHQQAPTHVGVSTRLELPHFCSDSRIHATLIRSFTERTYTIGNIL